MEYNTFNEVNQGDLVIRRGKNQADVRFVEGITRHAQVDGKNFPNDQISILLVNGHADFTYEGIDGIKRFNEKWRLLVKKENLIKEEIK